MKQIILSVTAHARGAASKERIYHNTAFRTALMS